MPTSLFQVDAFCDRPFHGNPAAVCLLEQPAAADWMQAVATEMNLAETAFLRPLGDGEWQLRWFTPTVEVDLCGHATLASAHILWQEELLASDRVALFQTRSGPLQVVQNGGAMEMDFPATPAEPVAAPPALMRALGISAPRFVGRTCYDYLLELNGAAEVKALQPDLTCLKEVDTRGVIVTARSDDPDYDFVSRFFAPAAGIDEDPVTGSAHCALGPYWETQLDKSALTAWQASSRGGRVQVRNAGERVLLGGQAITVLRGELLAEP